MHRSAVNGAKQPAGESPPLSDTGSLQRRVVASTAMEDAESSTLDRDETPDPDYEEQSQRRKSCDFVNNFQNVIFHIRTIDELYTCFPEPDPDYINDDEEDGTNPHSDFPPPPVFTAEELSAAVSEAYDMHVSNGSSMTLDDTYAGSSNPPLIRPKPLHNPCIESKERMALHKELLMNYRIGKDVLHVPELSKVMRERREKEKKKEWEEQKSSKGRTSLVIKLEERANRLKEEEEKKTKVTTEEAQAPELARIHRKITQKSAGNSE